jgi:hypothetical protein
VVRDEYLTAVPGGADAGAADDRRTEVVPLVAELRFTGVDGDPHPQRDVAGPPLRDQGPLSVERRCHGIGGTGERSNDAVAFALLDRSSPPVGRHDVVEDLVVAANSCGHPVDTGLLPRGGRPLDVGHQERDRSRRQCLRVS